MLPVGLGRAGYDEYVYDFYIFNNTNCTNNNLIRQTVRLKINTLFFENDYPQVGRYGKTCSFRKL